MRSAHITAAALILCAHSAAVATPTPTFSFTPLGHLPGAKVDLFSIGEGISRDGTAVVGSSRNASGFQEAFLWTRERGMIGLGDLPGAEFSSSARVVSADGSVVSGLGRIGLEDNIVSTRAFRWTESTSITDLGSIPPTNGFSNPWGMSGDGRYIIGTAQGPNGFEAFIYDHNSGQMSGIGAFEGRAISDDGSIAATTQFLNGMFTASRWTADTGHTSIGFLHPSHSQSDPAAMTPDGAVIVGYSAPVVDFVSVNHRAFRWTESTGMTPLPSVNPEAILWINEARAVSADGSLIGGFERAIGDDEQFAVIWHETLGAINLQSFLESRGVDLGLFSLRSVEGISGDGRTLVGTALDIFGNAQAYIVTIPAPSSALLMLAAFGIASSRRRDSRS